MAIGAKKAVVVVIREKESVGGAMFLIQTKRFLPALAYATPLRTGQRGTKTGVDVLTV